MPTTTAEHFSESRPRTALSEPEITHSRTAAADSDIILPDVAPNDTWKRLFLATAFLACCIGFTINIVDPDLWGHVQYGRDALREGLPRTATYTYTAEGYRWINHENLAELTLAFIQDHFGGRGLMVFKLLLGLPILGCLFYFTQKRRVSIVVQVTMFLLVSLNLTYGWATRPQLFTYTCFAALALLLDFVYRAGLFASSKAEEKRRLKWLWLTVPLFVVWANSHGGFVAGLCILWAYVGLRSIETFWRERQSAVPQLGVAAAIAATATIATLANPYGWQYWNWLYQWALVPRPEITEWRPMTLQFELLLPFLLLLGITILAAVFTQRKRDWTHLCLLAIFAWQTVEHTRHICFFALAAGFWMPLQVESAYQWFRLRRNPGDTNNPKTVAFGGHLLDYCLIAALVLVAGKLALRLDGLKVNKEEYPVEAFQFMADHNLTGRMVVNFNWAQYALAAFGNHGGTMQFDGRLDTCYPSDVVAAHFDFIIGKMPDARYREPDAPDFDDTRALEEGNPQLVVIQRGSHSEQVMLQRADWTLLYQDDLAQVWGRADKYAQPESPEFLPPADRVITDQPQAGFVSWPALPRIRNFHSEAAELDMASLAKSY